MSTNCRLTIKAFSKHINFIIVAVILIPTFYLIYSQLLETYKTSGSITLAGLTPYATSLSALFSLVGISLVYYQLRRNNDIKEAEFILQINKIFSDNKNIAHVYEILEKTNAGLPTEGFQEDDYIKIGEYLDFFEPIYVLVNKGILSFKEVDKFIPYRFFLAVNNEYVQEHCIRKYIDSYDLLFAFYGEWIKFRNKTGRAEPFSEQALSKKFAAEIEAARKR